ncbi:MAG: VIT1/CCC1 transporter family protein [Thermoprotei archaeon]
MKFDPRKEAYNEALDMLTYRKLAAHEKNHELAQLLNRLALIEMGHASFWQRLSEKMEMRIQPMRLKTRLLANLYLVFRKLFGISLTVKLLEMHEESAIKEYSMLLSQEGLFSDNEKRELEVILKDEKDHEQALIDEELRANPERVRDVIYGMSDALVEVLAAVSGLAGVLVKPLLVAAGGLIVGASGTLSMGAGAYVSTQSEKELSGAPTDQRHPTSSAIKSALATSISYLVGVFPPVLPYMLNASGLLGLLLSYTASAFSLFIVGSLVGVLSGTKPLNRGMEMVIIGIGAALATHAIGIVAGLYLHVNA